MKDYSNKLEKRASPTTNSNEHSPTSSEESIEDIEANLYTAPPSVDPTSKNTNTTATSSSSAVDDWKNSDFAVGDTEQSWQAEKNKSTCLNVCSKASPPHPEQGNPVSTSSSSWSSCIDCECCDDEMEHDCGCTSLSAVVCSALNAGKVGNMAVLKEKSDPHSGERKLLWVVGPFWPVLVFITFPLIIGVSVFVLLKISRNNSTLVMVMWLFLTGAVCCALFFTGCRDPGILYRYTEPPLQNWIWNDQAQTYRPMGAVYDSECGCIVEEFDHVCPWTGTAIGKKNMSAFKFFVSGICVLIVVDILLVVRVFGSD